MFKLDETFKNRRFTATTATPKSTFTKDSEEAAALTSWIVDCETLRKAVYNYAVTQTATVDDVFAAWRALFRYFPEKLTGTKLHAEHDDINIFIAACGKYVKADDGGKEWRDAATTSFRKVVEDTIVDRINDAKNKSLDTLAAERKARADARKAKKAAYIAQVAALLGCTETEAEAAIKAQAKSQHYNKAKKDFTTKDRQLAKQLDEAQNPGNAVEAA